MKTVTVSDPDACMQEEERCHNKTVSSLVSVPQESCDIVPERVCDTATTLVPHLEPVPTCRQLPRERCSFGVQRKQAS